VLRAIADRAPACSAITACSCFGAISQALALGVELETLCEQYWRACQLGEPVLLDAAEMATVLEKFALATDSRPERRRTLEKT
jgi:L-fuculose-phosphate aldolase